MGGGGGGMGGRGANNQGVRMMTMPASCQLRCGNLVDLFYFQSVFHFSIVNKNSNSDYIIHSTEKCCKGIW